MLTAEALEWHRLTGVPFSELVHVAHANLVGHHDR
jgi:hypothetical protein